MGGLESTRAIRDSEFIQKQPFIAALTANAMQVKI
jgi:hypothetical protein